MCPCLCTSGGERSKYILCIYIYIYIYIYTHIHTYIYIYIYLVLHGSVLIIFFCGVHRRDSRGPALHPVSITRFPLSRFSPGAGLLRNPFFTLSTLRLSRGWVRKDGNLVMETGCSEVRRRALRDLAGVRGGALLGDMIYIYIHIFVIYLYMFMHIRISIYIYIYTHT